MYFYIAKFSKESNIYFFSCNQKAEFNFYRYVFKKNGISVLKYEKLCMKGSGNFQSKKYINLKKKINVDTMASRLIKCLRNEKVFKIKKVFKTKKC